MLQHKKIRIIHLMAKDILNQEYQFRQFICFSRKELIIKIQYDKQMSFKIKVLI